MIEGTDLTGEEFLEMNPEALERIARREQQVHAPGRPLDRLVKLTPSRLRALQVEDRLARER